MFRIRSRYLFIFLLGAYSFLNIKFTEGDALLPNSIGDPILGGLILLLTLIIWEGNRFLSVLIAQKKFSRLSFQLLTHFGLSIVLVIVLSVLASLFTSYFLNATFQLFGFNQIVGFTFRINLFLHCINAIMAYNSALSSSQIEAEVLKKENLEARYDALRKQINPHFLFNSFNVLSSVIETDPKQANQFLEQLSKVYRYILKTEDIKKTSLQDEIEFLNSYIYLLKMRFNENLKVNLDLLKTSGTIPPSTLQLLIENAIKHNEVSKKHPLEISISQENGSLVVSNNKNPRENKEESSQVGLKNIDSRYQLLSKKSIEVIDKSDRFVVKVPILD